MRRCLLGIVCASALLSGIAQSQSAANFGHQVWSSENGLPQNSVHQIFQSQDGYIWIATEGGIARFNGIDFKVFNQENIPAFTSGDVCCFAEDSHGLWIGTSDGLLRYSAGGFRRYSVADGLPSADITALAASEDGNLYILSGNGVASFDGKNFTPLPLPATPIAMATAGNGALWLAYPSEIGTYQHGSFQRASQGYVLPKESIQSIGALPDGGVWVRTRSTLTLMQGGHQRAFQTGSDLPATRIESFLEDSRGELWIGTNKGLFLVDKTDSHPQLQVSVGTNSVLSLFEDKEGNLWVGTETAGLQILRQQSFHAVPALSDRIVTAITQTGDGAMWVGTNGDGLDRWQGGKLQDFSTHNGLASEVVLALSPGSHDSVWVGTPDGLNHIEGTKMETYTSAEGLPDDFIRSLLLDDDGSLWIGTRRGLAHLQNEHVTIFTRANGLKSELIGALVESRAALGSRGPSSHDLWIGTLDGLARLRDGQVTTYTKKDGLSGDVITSLFEDTQGTLWIGTSGDGLSRSTGDGFVSLRRDDLPHVVDAILEDGHGDLWLSSTRGITRVSRAKLIDCGQSGGCNLNPNSYGYSDGMPTDETSAIGHPAAWKTEQGLLWFATRKGVAIVDPNHLSENHIPPSVVIERFIVDDVEVTPPTAELKIPPGHSRFAFEYAGLSYAAPSKVRYRYILEGFDKQWTQAGSRRIAYYTNLPPHHYRFRVQAANNDGVWNDAGATIIFTVRPPFYRQWWFIVLALALLAAVGVLLYRLRVRRLQSQFDAVLAERNRMAREIHDTLAQSFVGVSVQLELTAQLLAQSQVSAAHQQIDRTRTYVREGLAEARRSIWDLRAITARDTLPTRLTRLVEQSNTAQLNIQLNIGGTYRAVALSMEDEVLRIAQEALSNVARHANATRVTVDLRYHPNRLTLTISDNGRGFQASDNSLPQKGHFGLQGMRERAAQIDAQIKIESSQEQGTQITLDAPITAEKGSKKNG